jgi:glycosyltransferase involved in cell wall biosynthesis
MSHPNVNKNGTATCIEVDVIIPVYNAATTVRDATLSALRQEIPVGDSQSKLLRQFLDQYSISITVCCYEDSSNDESLKILRDIETSDKSEQAEPSTITNTNIKSTTTTSRVIPSRLLVQSSSNDIPKGAGYARNRAIELNNPSIYNKEEISGKPIEKSSDGSENNKSIIKFICLLDSDDVMHKYRVIEQTLYMIYFIDEDKRNRTILGSTFDRDPPDSTWHYSNWANNLTDERLMLERYREITILQPTWFFSLSIWSMVGGYIESPQNEIDLNKFKSSLALLQGPCLVHPKYDTISSLRLAEDLRFFHSHLHSNGFLRVHRKSIATCTDTKKKLPLVTYRHFNNDQSQSYRTSRKLLLQLRALAFQQSILRKDPLWNINNKHFVIWGCGRDGKDFYKSLDPDLQQRVYCFVDVDAKKLNAGYYVDSTSNRFTNQQNKDDRKKGDSQSKNKKKSIDATNRKIPIVHFSFLIPGQHGRRIVQDEWKAECESMNDSFLGRIDKSKSGNKSTTATSSPATKKQKRSSLSTARTITKLHDRGLDQKLLHQLPVVVCVAMYRTSGVLEKNVSKINRVEGENLWHFS